MRASAVALLALLFVASASAQYLTVPSRYPGIGLGNPKCAPASSSARGCAAHSANHETFSPPSFTVVCPLRPVTLTLVDMTLIAAVLPVLTVL